MAKTATDRVPRAGGRSGPPASAGGRRWVVPVVALAVVLLAGAVAIGASALGRNAGTDAAQPQRAPVTVTGEALPPMPSGGAADAAIGQPAPSLQGTTLTGEPITVPGAGKAKLVMFLAHWCPHCQKEVPILTDYLPDNTPADVELYSIATATDSSLPNYPPVAWLDREGWPVVTMADSESNTAGQAYGVTGYPMFVAVDAAGNVVARRSGELSTAEVQSMLDAAASGAQ
ncbi:MAG: TlpA disulfide reductase family protein [Acidimicrobiales bacterium]